LAHITGGGFLENIPRVLPNTAIAEIDLEQVVCPPVFGWLRQIGNITEREMLRTFNCGIGMVIVVAEKEAGKIRGLLRQSGETVVTLGSIKPRIGDEPQVKSMGQLRFA
jgi:phosphoribosylformylglycinamidine cyclo-ligase